MKRVLVVFITMMLMLACSSDKDGINQINGKWIMDTDALMKIVMLQIQEESGTSAEENAENEFAMAFAKQLVDTIAGAFVFEFDTAKQEFRGKMGGDVETIKYTVLSATDKVFKLKMDKADGEVLVITVTGPDSITLGTEDEDEWPMIRAK